jgi:hypothetical protein
VAFAQNLAFDVNRVVGHGNHFRGNLDDIVRRKNHAIEYQFHPSLTNQMARILVVFETTGQDATTGKDGGTAYLTEDRVTDRNRF